MDPTPPPTGPDHSDRPAPSDEPAVPDVALEPATDGGHLLLLTTDSPVAETAAAPDLAPVPALEPDPEPEADEPARGRRWPRRVLVGTLVLGAVGWFAPAIVARTSLRDRIVSRATDGLLAGTVTVGAASAGWTSPVELRDVRVTDPAGTVIATVPVVRTSKTLLELARNRADLGTITVDRPAVTLACSPAGSNLEDLLRPLLALPSGTGDRPAVTVAVTNGTVDVRDLGAPAGQKVEAVSATVTVPRGRTEPITITASGTAGGPVTADLALGADATGTFTANGVTLGVAGPVVRRFAPGTQLSGTLSGKAALARGRVTVAEPVSVVALDLAGPWLGDDRLSLGRAELKPCRVELHDGVLTADGVDLVTDIGRATVTGSFDTDAAADEVLAAPGLKASADVDLARLAATLPKLIRVRDGVELQSGRVTAAVESVARDDGTGWTGTVRTTAIRATRDGQPVAWDQALHVDFAGRMRPDGLPEFDKLEVRGDFLGLAARGSPDEFVARANVNLDRFGHHLGELVDLGGAAFSGTGTVTVHATRRPDGGTNLIASADFPRFSASDGAGRSLDEKDLKAGLTADVRFEPHGPIKVSAGRFTLSSGPDTLTATLLEPVADARTLSTGKASGTLTGDMARWRWRFAPWAALPKHYVLGGTGTVAGEVHLTREAVRCPKLTADLANARFRGAGLDVDEPVAKLACGLTADRRTGVVAVTDATLSSETLGASARRIDLTPQPSGDVKAVGTAAVTANLSRLQRTIGLAPGPGDADALRGVAHGEVRFDLVTNGKIGFDAVVNGDKLELGPAAAPVWAEPWAKVTTAGTWDPRADAVKFDRLHIERDGLTADATGTAGRLNSPSPSVDVTGTLAYDLARLQPELRKFLGAEATAVGKQTKPFRLTGDPAGKVALDPPAPRPTGKFRVDSGTLPGAPPAPKFVPPPVSAKPVPVLAPLDYLAGSAAVGWDRVTAYGFDVGPSELKASLANRTVSFTPVEATFGGGTVRAVPSVSLFGPAELTLAPGRVVTKAKLSPAVCADAIGFVLPPLANAAQVEGLISADVADTRVPLGDPTKAAVKGSVLIHEATVSAGPVLSELIGMFGGKQTLTLAADQTVPFRVENGRVFHQDLKLMVEKTAVRTNGSVGFDGTLDLMVDVQVPPKLAQQWFPNNEKVREALAKRTIRVPLKGTLKKPQLDRGKFDDAVRVLVKEFAADAGKDALADLLKKQLEKKLGEKK